MFLMQIELWTWDLSGRRVPRVKPPETRVNTKSTLSTPAAQVRHPVWTKTGLRVRRNEATKFLNPLKYKTPDILKTLAAKTTLLQF